MPGLEAAKAYAALAVTLLGALTTALTAVLAPDTSSTHVVLGVLVAGSAVASALATYHTKNRRAAAPTGSHKHRKGKRRHGSE